MSAVTLATLAAVLTLDVTEFTKGASKASDDTKSLGDRLTGFAPIAAAGFVAAGAAIIGVGAALYSVGSEFESAYDKIRVGTGKSGEQLEQLKGVVKSVATEVPASLDDASTAVTMLSQRLGLSGHALEGLAGDFLDLSRVTGTDLTTNIQSITRVFGDWSISDTTKAMDEMFRTTQQTGVGIDKLAQEVVQFGAPLRGLGFGFEESLAMLGKWEKEGVNTTNVMGAMKKAYGTFAEQFGSKAPEEFRAFVTELSKAPTAAAAASMAIEKLGVRNGPDFAAAVKEGRFAYSDLVDQITNGSDTIMQAGEDTQHFSEKWQMFTNRMKVAVEPAAQEVFAAVGTALDKVTPYAEAAANWLHDKIPLALATLRVKWEELRPTIEEGARKLGDIAKTMGEHISSALGWMIDNDAALKGAAATVGIVLVGGFVALGVAAWTAASGVIAATWPVLAVAAAIGVLVGLLIFAYNNFETFHDVVNAVFGWLATNGPAIFNTIKDAVLEFYNVALAPLIGFIVEHADAFENLGKVLLIVGAVVVGVIVVGFLLMAAVFVTVIAAGALLLTAIGAVVAFLYNLAQVVWDVFNNVKDALVGAIEAVAGFVAGIPEKIGAFISAVVDFFVQLPGRILAVLVAFPGFLMNLFATAFNGAMYAVGFAIGSIIQFFIDLPGRILALAGFLWSVITTVFTTVKDTAINVVLAAVNGVIDFFAQLPGRAAAALSFLWGAISGAFFSAKDNATSTASNLLDSVLGFMRSLPGRAADAVSGFAGSVADKLREAVGAARSIGEDIIRGVGDGIKGMIGWATDQAKNAASNVVRGFKDALHISSPSRVMADEVGHWIPAGIAVGMQKNMGPLLTATRKMASAVVSTGNYSFADIAGPNAHERRLAEVQWMKAQAGSSSRPQAMAVQFNGNTSDALATVIMQMVRTGQIQIKAA